MFKWINDQQLKVGVWRRERQERAAAKKAARIHESGHDSRFWLLSLPAAATLCAAFVEVYWAILFCIEATGHLDSNWATAMGSEVPTTGSWDFGFSANIPVLAGLVAATVPIVIWSMVWLPVQMKARGHGRYRRITMIVAGLLANALVIISGTVVMNHNRQGQVREGLVVEQTAAQGRAAIDARLSVVQAELGRITDPSMTSNEARAARAGVAGWQTYVREATTDRGVPAADRQRIARAMGSAEAADALRARIETLTVERATAAPEAASAAVVQDDVGVGLNTFAQYAAVYRPPFVALLCTIIGIFGAWWWVGLAEAMNRHSVSLSGWAREDQRIEDMRDVPAPATRPMKPPREVVTDHDTGEELVRVQPHWRKLKKGKPQRVDIPPIILPDEVGTINDGGDEGLRSVGVVAPDKQSDEHANGERVQEPNEVHGRSAGAVDEIVNPNRADKQDDEEKPDANAEAGKDENQIHVDGTPDDEPLDPSDEEAEALMAEIDETELQAETEQTQDDEPAQEAAAEEPTHEPNPTLETHEPETDPRRLIAAE